jgi:hypothetical protein
MEDMVQPIRASSGVSVARLSRLLFVTPWPTQGLMSMAAWLDERGIALASTALP